MKSTAQCAESEELTSIEAYGDAAGRDDLLRAVHRLGTLHKQLNGLNSALKEMLDCASFPLGCKPLHRRRKTATAALERFRRQARKLAVYAPY